MQKLIVKLQQKSDMQRAFYATASAVGVVVLLFGVWGYNFARSNTISNIASGATGVISAVEGSRLQDNFKKTMEQLQQVSDFAVSNDLLEKPNQEERSIGVKHMNVFIDPNNASNIQRNYGENTADVLY